MTTLRTSGRDGRAGVSAPFPRTGSRPIAGRAAPHGTRELPGGGARATRSPAAAGRRSHQEYVQWRARQIAYGRWRPWGDAGTVREHVRALKRAGGTDRAIARTASVSVATVHRLQHGRPPGAHDPRGRVSAVLAGRLLAVTPATLAVAATRRDATGSRRRLQALTAMGHPGASLARHLDVPSATVWNLLRGRSATVSPDLDAAIRALYERIWNLRPSERTGAERRAAAAARARAAAHGWPAPAGLDDDRIDDPAFRPRSRWRPATGVGVADPPATRTGSSAGPDGWSGSDGGRRGAGAGRDGVRSPGSGHVSDAGQSRHSEAGRLRPGLAGGTGDE